MNTFPENINDSQSSGEITQAQIAAIILAKKMQAKFLSSVRMLYDFDGNLGNRLAELFTDINFDNPVNRFIAAVNRLAESSSQFYDSDSIENSNNAKSIIFDLLEEDMPKFSGSENIQDVKHGQSKYSVIIILMRGVKSFLLEKGELIEEDIEARRKKAKGVRSLDWWANLTDDQREEHIQKSLDVPRKKLTKFDQEPLREALSDLVISGITLYDIATLCNMDVVTLQRSLDYFNIKRAGDYWEEIKTALVDDYAYAILRGETTIKEVVSRLRESTVWNRISYSAVNKWFNEWVQENNLTELWEAIKSPALDKSDIVVITELASRGYTREQIAEKLSVTTDIIANLLRDHDVYLTDYKPNFLALKALSETDYISQIIELAKQGQGRKNIAKILNVTENQLRTILDNERISLELYNRDWYFHSPEFNMDKVKFGKDYKSWAAYLKTKYPDVQIVPGRRRIQQYIESQENN